MKSILSEKGDFRNELEIFSDLQSLASSPGFIHAAANLAIRDNMVLVPGDLRPKDISRAYSHERLLRTELSTLIGLMVKSTIDFKEPNVNVLNEYIQKADSLLLEMHHAISASSMDKDYFLNCLQTGANPFANGNAMREPIFYASESAYYFQYVELAIKRYQKDSAWITTHKGFSIEEAGIVVKAIFDFQPRKIQDVLIKSVGQESFSAVECLSFKTQDISELCGLLPEKVDKVINAFLLDSNSRNTTFEFLHDFNAINAAPILKKTNDEFILLQSVTLLEALYEAPFYWFLEDHSYRKYADANRGRFVEDITAEFLGRVFGSTNIHKNVQIALSKDRVAAEIDVLVLYGDRALIFQNKSKKLTIDARKGNDLIIKKDFQRGIQSAYDQAILCSKELLNSENTVRDSDNQLLKVNRPIKEIFIFCVISEQYPALALQARTFLNLTKSDVIKSPYVADIFTLDVLTEFLDSPLHFLSYVSKRAKLYEQLMAQHELSILGYHLKNNLHFGDESIYFGDDLSVDIDVAMAVRRTNVQGKSTPSGVLTRFSGTLLEKILISLAEEQSPEAIEVGLFLLSLSEKAWFDISKTISHLGRLVIKDQRSHDVSLPLREDKTGLTIHINNFSKPDAKEYLLEHCHKRKYLEKASYWLGIALDPLTLRVKGVISLDNEWEYDSDLESVTAKMKSTFLPTATMLKRLGDDSDLKVGRNDKCKCGSGRKYKKCCLP